MADREKAVDRAAKLKAMMESAAKIGSEAEAQAFAAAVSRLMLEHDLSEAEISQVHTDEPIEEIEVDREMFGLGRKKARIGWNEVLASIVAEAHLCKFLVLRKTNRIWFIGTKKHADVACYMYATLVRLLDHMATSSYNRYCKDVFERDGSMRAARGYRNSFITGFIGRLKSRYTEERKKVVHEAPQGQSLALVHISKEMTRVEDHYNTISGEECNINFRVTKHKDGLRAGIKAANDLNLKANALTTDDRRKKLKEGNE